MTTTSDPPLPGETSVSATELRAISIRLGPVDRALVEAAASQLDELSTTLARERANHCVCKCDDDGDFISQCLTHKEVENERNALREANDNMVRQKAGLEALLVDAQKEIGELRADLEKTESMLCDADVECAELTQRLRDTSAPHANFAECEARLLEALNRNMELRREFDLQGRDPRLAAAMKHVEALEAALRPFAEMSRRMYCDVGADTDAVEIVMSMREMRRAAELVPPNT